jgi:putative transposase
MVYHVISRGNNRERVFNEREDFEKYLEICRRYKEKFGFKLYHWVFMSNHVHLVMETTEESSLSKIMQGINLAYTIWFNRENGKVGHLWQDRFKSALVEKDNYLLECGRYVERNPLRARLVRNPKEYRWSSYRVYAYGKADGVTDRHAIYDAMGKEDRTRRKSYREYVSIETKRSRRSEREWREGLLGQRYFGRRLRRELWSFGDQSEADQ